MKKTLIACILALSAPVAAPAQTMNDALTQSQNDYYGTAKTIGMGGAVTAVGGDLGTVGINPAGSAVAGYSQITLSPGLVISSNQSSYAPSYADYHSSSPGSPLPTSQAFGASSSGSSTNFRVPNLGVAFRFDTGRSSGVRAFTLGLVTNMTSCYDEQFCSGGVNRGTSMAGSFASYATVNADGSGNAMPGNILSRSEPFSSQYYWNYIASYWGGMINYNADSGTYFGSTETVSRTPGSTPGTYSYDYYVAGALDQSYSSRTSGLKQDILINMSLDINDCIFLGLNVGVPDSRYKYSQSFTETSDDPYDFPVTPEYISSSGSYVKGSPTYFDHSEYRYYYDSESRGLYGKIGLIWLPTENLRLGGAVQTPTFYHISETWQVGIDTYFTDGSHEYCDSETGAYNYSLVSPWLFNVGAAYTFGSIGMLSVDYELTDFSAMRYVTLYVGSSDVFSRVNTLCSLFCGASHSLRIGAEFRPLPFLSVRAGYSLKTDPTYTYVDGSGQSVDSYAYDSCFQDFKSGRLTLCGPKKAGSDNVSAVSLGLGFSSKGSFFADFAVRRTAYPASYYTPYAAYLDSDEVTVYSPEIRTVRSLWDAVFTFGFRF